MDWDQARIFLAIARTGQMLAAARALHLDHATVSRRINALEANLRVKLLDRRTTGCTLTPAGEAFHLAAEPMESEMLGVQAQLSGMDVAISGTVRIGAPDGFGTSFLAPRIGSLMDRHPGLLVQLAPLPRTFSLAKREADLLVTIDRPTEGRLSVSKLTDYALSLYATSAWLARNGQIHTLSDLSKHRVVTYVSDLLFSPALHYFDDLRVPFGSRFECASVVGQLEAVRAGVGIGFLHDYVAANHPDLVRVLPDIQVLRADWLVSHDDNKSLARIRAVRDWMVEAVRGARGFM